MTRRSLTMRMFAWRVLQIVCIIAALTPCFWGFEFAGRPPYGGRARYALLIPIGHSGAGAPRPVITRSGERLQFSGFQFMDDAESIAIVASDPRPTGSGLFCPVIYEYPYGKIRWNVSAFPVKEQQRLRSEIDRMRREIATALQTERAHWYSVPPGYFQKYAAGEGTMWVVSWSGVAVHLGWVGVIVLAVVAWRRARAVRDRLAAMKEACRVCGYDLANLPVGRCPECGTMHGGPDAQGAEPPATP